MNFLVPAEQDALKKETSDTIENKIKPVFDAIGFKTEIHGAEIKRLVASTGNRYVEVFYHFDDDCYYFEFVQAGSLICNKSANGPRQTAETAKTLRPIPERWMG